MVMDEDRFQKQFLSCNVCKTCFGSGVLPRLLPCHHSFCHPCVLKLYQLAKDQRVTLQATLRSTTLLSTVTVGCPTCRINFIATDESVQKLPTDHRIVQLIDFVRHTERSTISFCSKHNMQPLHFFCEPCVRPICRDCTKTDHNESDGHLVMDLEEAMAKYTPVLETAIAEMDSQAKTLEEKRANIDTVTENLDTLKVDLIADARACMDRLRKLIIERQKALELKIHREIDNEKAKLKEKGQDLVDRRKRLETQTDRLKQAKAESNVEDLFHIHQEVKEYMNDPSNNVKELKDDAVTSFALNVRDENLLASRITNFGDVGYKVQTPVNRNKPSMTNYYRNSAP